MPRKTDADQPDDTAVALAEAEQSAISELCKPHAPKMVKNLVAISNSRKARSAARVSAARAVLEYGFGRPTQISVSKSDARLTIVIQKLGDGGEPERIPLPEPKDVTPEARRLDQGGEEDDPLALPTLEE